MVGQQLSRPRTWSPQTTIHPFTPSSLLHPSDALQLIEAQVFAVPPWSSGIRWGISCANTLTTRAAGPSFTTTQSLAFHDPSTLYQAHECAPVLDPYSTRGLGNAGRSPFSLTQRGSKTCSSHPNGTFRSDFPLKEGRSAALWVKPLADSPHSAVSERTEGRRHIWVDLWPKLSRWGSTATWIGSFP